MSRDPLAGVAAELARSRVALTDAMDDAAQAVRDEYAANGGSEQELARRVGVSRMTVRGWLGRPVPKSGRPVYRGEEHERTDGGKQT